MHRAPTPLQCCCCCSFFFSFPFFSFSFLPPITVLCLFSFSLFYCYFHVMCCAVRVTRSIHRGHSRGHSGVSRTVSKTSFFTRRPSPSPATQKIDCVLEVTLTYYLLTCGWWRIDLPTPAWQRRHPRLGQGVPAFYLTFGGAGCRVPGA